MTYVYVILCAVAIGAFLILKRRLAHYVAWTMAVTLIGCSDAGPQPMADAGLPDAPHDADAAVEAGPPLCHFDADCDFLGICSANGMCTPWPPGHCFTTTDCQPPVGADLSCTSTFCNTATDTCETHDSQFGTPCGAPGMQCDGNGHCIIS